MRSFSDFSIRHKLKSMVMITCIVALLMASVVHIVTEVVAFRHSMAENLSSLAHIIGNNSTAALVFEDR